jgi:hypothetical protein
VGWIVALIEEASNLRMRDLKQRLFLADVLHFVTIAKIRNKHFLLK